MGYTTPVRRRLVATLVAVAALAVLGAAIGLSRADGAPSDPQPPVLKPVFDLLGPNDAEPNEQAPPQQPGPQPQPTPSPAPVLPLPQPQPQPTPPPDETPAPDPKPEPTASPEQPPQEQPAPPPESQPQPQPQPGNGATFRTAPAREVATVRIKGYLVRGGARVTRLSVSASSRTRVTVTCRGRGCPVSRRSDVMAPGTARLRAFERFLPAGVRLTIRITSPDRVGKYTYIRIRRDRVPLRRDSCLDPGKRQPVSCPA